MSGARWAGDVDRIVHAADLHLGAPLHSLGRHIDADKADHVRALARSAFDDLIRLTIEEQARALVLAGDVYDNAEREVRSQLRFDRGMRDLAEAGIRVFIAHGNHDPLASTYRPATKLPGNVTVFAPGDVQSHEVPLSDGSSLTVSGVSFSQAAETENLAARFAGLRVDPRRSLAVLHTNLDGAVGHDNYAPCSRSDLEGAPVGYWALGHIHDRRVEVLGPDRFLAYPGNLQGRSAKATECGSKGALVVPVTGGGFGEPRFVACDRVRFVRLDVDVSAAADVGEVFDLVEARSESAVAGSDGRLPLLRIRLMGPSAAHADLADEEGLLAELRERMTTVLGDGEVLRLEVATRRPIDRAQLLARRNLVSELLVRIDESREDPGRAAALIADLPSVIDQALPRDVDVSGPILDEVERILINALGPE